MRYLQYSLFFMLLMTLSACTSTPVDTSKDVTNYFNQHADLMASLPPTATTVAPEDKFQSVFYDFDVTMTENNLRELYANDIYFNDTFVTLSTLDDLLAYMQKTAESVISSRVEIVDVAKSDSDYYLRWVMDIEFDARSKRIRSKSAGMTQLRFNAEGKVIFHQDFWDSSNAFYQHLPVIGGLVKRVKNSLH